MKRLVIAGIALVLVAPSASNVNAQGNALSFFITSTNPGKGADLGGLAGADLTQSHFERAFDMVAAAKDGKTVDGPIWLNEKD